MIKNALIFLFLLTFHIVSAGQHAIVPGKNNASFRNFNNQSPDYCLTFCRLNLDKFLGSSDIPCLKNYVTHERQENCAVNTASSVLQPAQNGRSHTRFRSGGPLKNLPQKNLAKLDGIVYVEDLYPSGVSSGTATGISDDPNHFVSYYPGLLNEKIL